MFSILFAPVSEDHLGCVVVKTMQGFSTNDVMKVIRSIRTQPCWTRLMEKVLSSLPPNCDSWSNEAA